MSRSAEIRKLRQEAELLRGVAVEKGIVGSPLDQAAWERVARVMNLNATTVKSRWRTESHRLREMEEILNAQPVWEERQSTTQSAHTVRPPRSHHQSRGPNRIGQQRQQRSGNPYPPVIVIADDDAAGNIRAPNNSSPMAITQTRVERTLVTQQRRHRRGSRAEAHRFPVPRQ